MATTVARAKDVLAELLAKAQTPRRTEINAPHGTWPNDCWLDGAPAIVSWGDWAMVRRLDNGAGFQWSTQAARSIMNRDRRFRSM